MPERYLVIFAGKDPKVRRLLASDIRDLEEKYKIPFAIIRGETIKDFDQTLDDGLDEYLDIQEARTSDLEAEFRGTIPFVEAKKQRALPMEPDPQEQPEPPSPIRDPVWARSADRLKEYYDELAARKEQV